jgi:phenylacetate-CoA oxygenase PaaI subunit
VSGTIASAAELDAPVRAALRRHILGLADSKRLLGIRYSDWLLGAPSIETGIAASGMAQDEWGHARLLYALLKDFEDDPQVIEHDRPASAYASIDPLDEPLGDWAAVVSAMVAVDGALTVALEALSEGSYEPARARVPKMVTEEAFHRDLGLAWMRRLAAGTDEARDRVTTSLGALLPRTLAWLAPSDDAHALLVEAGLTLEPASVLERFREDYGDAFADTGLDPGALDARRDGWDTERGRGPGHPDEESVTRARGDLNRALFVE